MNTYRTKVAVLAAGSLLSLPVRAETWSFSGAMAIPERTTTGTNKTTPFFDRLQGAGVRFIAGATGLAVLYMPVVLPSGTVLRSMSFKVQGIAAGSVKADLYQQPAEGGIPVRIGTLSVSHKTCTGSGIARINVSDRTVNAKNVYFVRFELSRDSAETNLAMFSFSASDLRCADCPPGPEWRCLP